MTANDDRFAATRSLRSGARAPKPSDTSGRGSDTFEHPARPAAGS